MTVVMKNTITWHCPFFPLQRAVICDNIVIVFMKTNDQKNCSSLRAAFYCANTQNFAALWKTVCVCAIEAECCLCLTIFRIVHS